VTIDKRHQPCRWAEVMISTKVATIVFDKAGQIKIKVPTGAKTGEISVTTAGGTAREGGS
jgi:hypothetical protein